ncbi:hypothetical protein YC2023_082731 [Brassica napus]
MGSPQADGLSTQMLRNAVRRVLQTMIKAATSPRTGLLRSASDQDASPAPIRFPPDNFKHSLTLFSNSFSSLPRGTCSLSVSRSYLALDGSGHDGALTLSGAPFQGTWARSVAEDASPDYNSNAEDVRFSSWALPGLWVIKSFRTETTDDLMRVEFATACQDASGILSSDFSQPRAVTHGRPASIRYPREDGGTTICDTQADVPSARRLGEPLVFKDSMVHGILQFTPSIAFCYVLHHARAEISVAESRFRLYIASLLPNKHHLWVGESRPFS